MPLQLDQSAMNSLAQFGAQINGAELVQADAWTGGARLLPESGYYTAEITNIEPNKQKTGLKVTVTFEGAEGSIERGFESVENLSLVESGKFKRDTMVGKFKGFLQALDLASYHAQLTEAWANTQNWTAALLVQVIQAVQGEAAKKGMKHLVHVSFAKPPEGVRGTYGELVIMLKDEWAKAKAAGRPPVHSGRNVEGSDEQKAAGGPVGLNLAAFAQGAGLPGATVPGPMAVPSAAMTVPTGFGGGMPSAAPSFSGVPGASTPMGAVPGAVPGGFTMPPMPGTLPQG